MIPPHHETCTRQLVVRREGLVYLDESEPPGPPYVGGMKKAVAAAKVKRGVEGVWRGVSGATQTAERTPEVLLRRCLFTEAEIEDFQASHEAEMNALEEKRKADGDLPRVKTLKRAKPEEIPRAASAGEPVRVKMVDPMEDKGRGGRRQATTAAAPSTVRTAKWLKDRADSQLWFDKVLEASRVGDGGGEMISNFPGLHKRLFKSVESLADTGQLRRCPLKSTM